jgi:hypothetical protein
MKHVIWLVAALAVARPAVAAEAKKKRPPAAQQEAAPVDPKLKDAAASARFLFRRHVDMCTPAQRCDKETLTVVDESEERFVKACRSCTSEKKCEEDRGAIRSGKSSSIYNPCE